MPSQDHAEGQNWPEVEPITRETLDGWQAGVATGEVVYWITNPTHLTLSAAQQEAVGLASRCEQAIPIRAELISTAPHAVCDRQHLGFDADLSVITPAAFEDYLERHGQPRVEMDPDMALSPLQDHFDMGALAAAFAWAGHTFWTAPKFNHEAAAQLEAVRLYLAVEEMFGDRRPEPATVRYGPENDRLLHPIEVTRGPEVRVYWCDDYLKVLVMLLNGDRP